jgi:hypothetical protein
MLQVYFFSRRSPGLLARKPSWGWHRGPAVLRIPIYPGRVSYGKKKEKCFLLSFSGADLKVNKKGAEPFS